MSNVKSLIVELLSNNSTTFASISYATKVATSAKFKDVCISKHTTANVVLFSQLTDFDVYRRAVVKSATKLENDSQKVESFETQENYYEHDTNCFSIVKHKTKESFYLYAHFNNAQSKYYIDNIEVSKEDIMQYLTKSAAEKLMQDNSIIHNKANDVYHSIICRTISLENLKSITANKTRIEFN
jgi:hypothetical protein